MPLVAGSDYAAAEKGTSQYDATMQDLLAFEQVLRCGGDQALLASSGQERVCCCPNVVWREKVAQWCYDIVDHLSENRSLVYIAMNILDRYVAVLSRRLLPVDDRTYEIASMTAIFLAIRISGAGRLRVQDLISMSRRGVSVSEFVAMGTSMVDALVWDHRLVTPSDFLAILAGMLLPTADQWLFDSKQTILELAHYLVEIAVCDVELSRAKASDLAVAAFVNAVRSSTRSGFPGPLAEALELRTGIRPDSTELCALSTRLFNIYGLSADGCQGTARPHLVMDEDDEDGKNVETRSSSDGNLVCRDNPNVQPIIKRGVSDDSLLNSDISCVKRSRHC